MACFARAQIGEEGREQQDRVERFRGAGDPAHYVVPHRMDAEHQGRGGSHQWPAGDAARDLIGEVGGEHVEQDRGAVPAGRVQAEQCVVDAIPKKIQRAVIVVGWFGAEMLPDVPGEIAGHESPGLHPLVLDELPMVVENEGETQCRGIDQGRQG